MLARTTTPRLYAIAFHLVVFKGRLFRISSSLVSDPIEHLLNLVRIVLPALYREGRFSSRVFLFLLFQPPDLFFSRMHCSTVDSNLHLQGFSAIKMKTSFVSLIPLLASASAHTIFQKLSANGADKDQLVGLRAPDSDHPVQDVSSTGMACNTGLTHLSDTVTDVPAGVKVGARWGHVIDGVQITDDPDNSIAKGDKGSYHRLVGQD